MNFITFLFPSLIGKERRAFSIYIVCKQLLNLQQISLTTAKRKIKGKDTYFMNGSPLNWSFSIIMGLELGTLFLENYLRNLLKKTFS